MKIIIQILILISIISCSLDRKKTERLKQDSISEINSVSVSDSLKKIDRIHNNLKDTTELFFVKLLKSKKDTVVDYNYLSNDFVISTEIEFNYPKLENKTFNDNYLVLSNDTLEVKLKEIKFKQSKHVLTFQDTLKIPKKWGLIKIDGAEYYGSDGEMPKTEIDEIQIKQGSNQIELPPDDFKNLCNTRFNPRMTNVYIANKGRLILTFWGSDGAGAYFATLIIRNGKTENRIIDYGF